MTKKITFLAILFSAVFWPLGLILNNPGDYAQYIIPALSVAFSYIVFRNHPVFVGLSLIVLSFFFPHFLVISPLFFLVYSFFNVRKGIFLFLFSLILLSFRFSHFQRISNFHILYQSLQKVLGNINLYPSVWYARLMQNKLKIITDQVFTQLFALLDPNNYFFAFHPRELRVNQSLIKLPFASLPLLLFALYYLPSHPFKKTIVPLAFSSILGLSFLGNFDRHDLILYPLLISLLIFGARHFRRNFPRFYIPYLFSFFLFTTIEFIRLIIPDV